MRAHRVLLMALALAAISAGGLADIPSRSGFSMYFARMVGTALPYVEDNRWNAYLTISRIAEVLFHEDRFGTDIATLTTDTFDGFPLLVLTDNDGDKCADFFAYHENAEREFTREFGTFLAIGDDPQPAWIVFNNGTIPETLDTDDWVFYWATHQFVDRDGDGRFDLYVGSGTDTDDDGKSGTQDTLWVFDDNHDGRIDRAETIVFGAVRVIEPVDGTYRFGGTYGRDIDVATTIFDLPNAIADDISTALEGTQR